MNLSDRLEASASDDGRTVSLSTPLPTTQSTCSTRRASYPVGILERSGSRVTRLTKSSAATFQNFYTEEERAAGIPDLALKIAASEGRFEREGWRVRKDGTRFWAHVVIDPIRSPDGELIGYAKVTRDLTERRAAEEALRRSEQQFRLLVQGVTDYAIFMLDPEGHVASWNAGAQRIKGYAPDEIIGSHFSRFYTSDAGRRRPDAGPATAARDGRWEAEGCARKDGRPSGRTSSSTPSATKAARSSASPRLPATSPSEKRPSKRCSSPQGALPSTENGGARPTHRRRGTRLQQPAASDQQQLAIGR